jgi:hypothetical protein
MKPFTIATLVFLGFVSVAQLVRFILQVPAMANGVAIPPWVSAIACVVTAVLAIGLWRETRR